MTNNYREIFGNTVRQARTTLSVTQEQLAAEIGMDITSVNEIENGHRNPTLSTIVKISRALKIKPSALLAEMDNA